MRRSLTISLKYDELQRVDTSALERLVRSMGVHVSRGLREPEGAYRRRVIHAIQRWEANAKKGRVGLYAE